MYAHDIKVVSIITELGGTNVDRAKPVGWGWGWGGGGNAGYFGMV
jgi:hypothetical protein